MAFMQRAIAIDNTLYYLWRDAWKADVYQTRWTTNASRCCGGKWTNALGPKSLAGEFLALSTPIDDSVSCLHDFVSRIHLRGSCRQRRIFVDRLRKEPDSRDWSRGKVVKSQLLSALNLIETEIAKGIFFGNLPIDSLREIRVRMTRCRLLRNR